MNGLSFDLEDWYQVLYFEDHISRDAWAQQESRVAASTARLLEILARHDTRATFFVLAWNAERMPEIVESIVRHGHEVASHGYAHHLIHRQSPRAFADDIAASVEVLRAISGQPVRGYRAPSFSLTQETAWAIPILLDHGIEYDSSILPVRRPYGGVAEAPRAPWRLSDGNGRTLWELPPATMRVLGRSVPFGGGGYFRLLPYPIVRWALRRLNRAGAPGFVYLHPWELDPGQPVLPVRRSHRFQHYVNLHRTAAKLDQLLADFAFVPFGELLETLPDSAAPVLTLGELR